MNLNLSARIADYLRPWKLASFAAGLGLLLVGADFEHAPDWDYPVSFLMATLTYLTAPWAVRTLRARRWSMLPLALFWCYLSVDGVYWLYWRTVQPDALAMREANFLASFCLYWLCGFIWLHDGPLRTLLKGAGVAPVEAPERLSLWQIAARLGVATFLFYTAYFVYSMTSGAQRMTSLCAQIRSGMEVGELRVFAERHGLGPRRQLDAHTTLAYLAEGRTFGRHACRVELERGKVRSSSYNFAD